MDMLAAAPARPLPVVAETAWAPNMFGHEARNLVTEPPDGFQVGCEVRRRPGGEVRWTIGEPTPSLLEALDRMRHFENLRLAVRHALNPQRAADDEPAAFRPARAGQAEGRAPAP